VMIEKQTYYGYPVSGKIFCPHPFTCVPEGNCAGCELRTVVNPAELAKLEEQARQAAFLRPAVLWFATEMEKCLQANDHKGGWEHCEDVYLVDRLYDEIEELEEALVHEDPERIIREAGDVANFAMMLADQARRKPKRKKGSSPQLSATHIAPDKAVKT
jgi:hypothetical protein